MVRANPASQASSLVKLQSVTSWHSMRNIACCVCDTKKDCSIDHQALLRSPKQCFASQLTADCCREYTNVAAGLKGFGCALGGLKWIRGALPVLCLGPDAQSHHGDHCAIAYSTGSTY